MASYLNFFAKLPADLLIGAGIATAYNLAEKAKLFQITEVVTSTKNDAILLGAGAYTLLSSFHHIAGAYKWDRMRPTVSVIVAGGAIAAGVLEKLSIRSSAIVAVAVLVAEIAYRIAKLSENSLMDTITKANGATMETLRTEKSKAEELQKATALQLTNLQETHRQTTAALKEEKLQPKANNADEITEEITGLKTNVANLQQELLTSKDTVTEKTQAVEDLEKKLKVANQQVTEVTKSGQTAVQKAKDEAQKKDEKIQDLTSEITTLKNCASANKTQLEKTTLTLKDAETTNANAKATIQEQTTQITDLKRTLADKENEIKTNKKTISEHKATIVDKDKILKESQKTLDQNKQEIEALERDLTEKEKLLVEAQKKANSEII